MRIEFEVMRGICPETGTVKTGGAVFTEEVIIVGQGEGCGIPSCSCSNGYWISLLEQVQADGTRKLARVIFTSREEFEQTLGVLIKNKDTHNCVRYCRSDQ